MNKNDIQDLVMGVAVVALGYALYTQFKPGKTVGGAGAALRRAAAHGGSRTGVLQRHYRAAFCLRIGGLHHFGPLSYDEARG